MLADSTPWLTPDPVEILERTVIEVRLRWFGGVATPHGTSVVLEEPDGVMVIALRTDEAALRAAMQTASARSSYLVLADRSGPSTVPSLLASAGFRLVQRRGVYQFGSTASAFAPRRHRLIGLLALLRRPRPAVVVEKAGPSTLETWSTICWTVFGQVGSIANAVREKEAVYQRMGADGRWFLARVGDDPAGVAMRFQGSVASQILAVGTLPAYRKHGVATTVLREIVTQWEREGRGPLFLDTEIGGPAERLYINHGFHLTYVRDVYAPPTSQT